MLARPEFQPPAKTWLDSAREWVLDKIGGVWAWFWSLVNGDLLGPWVGRLILAVLIIACAFVLGRLIHGILGSVRSRKVAAPAPVALGTTTIAIRSSSPHLRAASEHAAAGRFLEAAHALYLGVILWLDEAGRVRYEESKTGEEYARDLDRSPLGRPFRAIIGVFYPVAFGGRPAAREAYARMRETATEMGVVE